MRYFFTVERISGSKDRLNLDKVTCMLYDNRSKKLVVYFDDDFHITYTEGVDVPDVELLFNQLI